MKKISGSVLLMLIFLVLAIGGAAALAIGGINVVQRAVGAHTEEAKHMEAEQSAAATPHEAQQPAAGTPRMSAQERQDWADAKITQWLAAYGDESTSDLTEPYRHVEAWFSATEGELELLTSRQKVSDEADLKRIAQEVMRQLENLDPSVHSVKVTTSDGTMSHTVVR